MQFIYEDFSGHNLNGSGSIEIVTVDPNADGYDTDSEDEDSDQDNQIHLKSLNFDQESQYSFRTRTDSSSIGDYESHTSDYDDNEDDENDDVCDAAKDPNCTMKTINNTLNQPKDILMNVIGSDDFVGLDASFHKSRTLSTNTIGSDVDALGLNIDANNFDLADFITKDDFTINIPAEHTIMPPTKSHDFFMTNSSISKSENGNFISSNPTDSDSDSDVIVDIETVDAEEESKPASDLLKPLISPTFAATAQSKEERDIAYVDNVQSDPSWTPAAQARKCDAKAEVSNNKNMFRNKGDGNLLICTLAKDLLYNKKCPK